MNRNKKSSWNRGLHTPKVQSLLDKRAIWQENSVWCRKCPSCQKVIRSHGKSAFYGCMRLYRDKRMCNSCGRRTTKQNLIGKVFNKLTVIGEAPYHKNDFAPYWKCRCVCGKITNVRAYHLTSGITNTCGSSYHRTGAANYRWGGYEEISGTYLCSIKKGARARGIPFNISLKQMWEQFLKQERKCAFTGTLLTFKKNQRHGTGTASLDRIDSSKGYTKGNIQWVHKDINYMKNDFSSKEFLGLCNAVVSKTPLPS